MESKGSVAVTDSGPLIHLNEVGALDALKIFGTLFVAPEVKNEVRSLAETVAKKTGNVAFFELSGASKDFTRIVSENYSLDLGEAESIALCRQEGASLFLTDDLNARTTAKSLGLEVHGTVGVLLRAMRGKKIPKQRAIECVKNLHRKSTLYITRDLIEYALEEMEKT